ncbi:MAG: hypothetical protein ACI9UT_003075 [Flavobacteriales bacterium]|jgi:hypothetical protein
MAALRRSRFLLLWALYILENSVTEDDLKFFLHLEKKANQSQVFFIVAAVLLTTNSIWDVVPFLGRGFSLGVGMVLIANSIKVKLRATTTAQCHDLIEKLINRDAELIKRANEFENI